MTGPGFVSWSTPRRLWVVHTTRQRLVHLTRLLTPALFVTCEMSPLELLRRITARVTETFLGRLKSGEYEPGRVVRLAQEACQTATDLALMDATTAPADAAH